MANQTGASLEEITWRSPGHVQAMGGFLHSNNILFYFAESPFFDGTSNNASLTLQATYNESLRPFIETREAFESRLKTMQGLEFVVAHDPLIEFGAALEAAKKEGPVKVQQQMSQEPSNIWVIRKQMRRKVPGKGDEIEALATYFVVGDSIYMAPSVYGVVGSRMLSTVTSLTKAMSAASSLPLFSASHGHTYTRPVPAMLEPSRTSQVSSQGAASASMAEGAKPSKYSSEATIPAEVANATQNARNFAEGMRLMLRYGDEYIDETPLVGEPGSFIFSSSKKPDARPVSTVNKPTPSSTVPLSAAETKPGTPLANLGDRSVATPGGAKDRKRKKSRADSLAP